MQQLMDSTIQGASAYRDTVTEQMVDTFIAVSGMKDTGDKIQKISNRLNALEQMAKLKRKLGKKEEQKENGDS